MQEPQDLVLHADEALVVARKPAGWLAVPGRGEDKADCLWARLAQHWPDLRVVHRLDMATSGLMLFAQGLAVQRQLSRAFEQREVAKRYVAVVCGLVAEESGRIDLPLAADWPNRPRQRVDAAHGRPALTLWQRLAVDAQAGTTRLALVPVTGRTHQMRVHLAAAGHTIVGDMLYESPQAAPRLLLHAERLEFRHPLSGAPVGFTDPPPF
ncbi:MAG: RluA family pseudouridine synthase [Rubrivivax sp.]